MANSYIYYAGNGSLRTFTTPPYLEESHLEVVVDGNVQTLGVNYTLSGTSLTFAVAPANAVEVRIARSSSRDARLTDYSDASLLTADTLDLDSNQLFYLSQEAFDTASETNISGIKFYTASTAVPSDPITGNLWFDINTKSLKIYDGTDWKLAIPTNSSHKFETFSDDEAGYNYVSLFTVDESALVFLNGVKQVRAETKGGLIATPTTGDYFVDLTVNRIYFSPLSAGDVVEVVVNLINSTGGGTGGGTSGGTGGGSGSFLSISYNDAQGYYELTDSLTNISVILGDGNGNGVPIPTITDNGIGADGFRTFTINNGAGNIVTFRDGKDGEIPQLGVDYFDGNNGAFKSFIYYKSPTQPAAPSGGTFNGASETFPITDGAYWTDTPSATGSEVEWVSTIKYVHSSITTAWTQEGSWSQPSLNYRVGQGPQGNQGVTGAIGATGNIGPQGPIGVQGLQGTAGVGTAGAQGIQGLTGEQGPQGATGGIGLTGATGAQGVQGVQGDAGANGTSVSILGTLADEAALGSLSSVTLGDGYIIDGDLYVCTSTTAPITAASFTNVGQVKGDTGTQGLAGNQGAQGVQGLTGAQGLAGAQGLTGAQGIEGQAGATGQQGDQGIQGATGAAGATGATGATGGVGQTGAAGAAGLPTYIHYAYASNSTGALNFHVSDAGAEGVVRQWLGILVDNTVEDSVDPSDYTWSLFRGADGISLVWQGTLSAAPANPANGWSYKNSSDGKGYVYQDGEWFQTTVDGLNGNDGIDGMRWQGTQADTPENPQLNWAYKDTDNGVVYIYNGTAWEVMSESGTDGNHGEDGVDGEDGLNVYIAYHNNPTSTQPYKPHQKFLLSEAAGNTEWYSNGWSSSASSASNWMIQKTGKDNFSTPWGDPIMITGLNGTHGTHGINGAGQFSGDMTITNPVGSAIFTPVRADLVILGRSGRQPVVGDVVTLSEKNNRQNAVSKICDDLNADGSGVYGETVALYIDGGLVVDGTIIGTKLAANSITSDKIEVNTLKADRIEVNTLDVGGKAVAGSIGMCEGVAGVSLVMSGWDLNADYYTADFADAAPYHMISNSDHYSYGAVMGLPYFWFKEGTAPTWQTATLFSNGVWAPILNHWQGNSSGSIPNFTGVLPDSGGDIQDFTTPVLMSHSFTTHNFAGTQSFIIDWSASVTGYFTPSSIPTFAMAVRETTDQHAYMSTNAADYVSTSIVYGQGITTSGTTNMNELVSLEGNKTYHIWIFGFLQDVWLINSTGSTADGVVTRVGDHRGISNGKITVQGLNA